MFSRVENNKPTRSRKRQKVSHVAENAGESSTRAPPRVANETSTAQSGEQPAMEESSPCAHKKELGAIEEDLEAMRQLITCKICQRFLTEPYGLACGHTYCYICLDTWLVAQHKNTCPECRAVVNQEPVPSLIIREMVTMFSTKQELLPEGETIEELEVNAKEAASKVARDKKAAKDRGMFKGMFAGQGLHEAVYDSEDHVHRCPWCFHEVEDGLCSGCGQPMAGMSQWSEIDDFGDSGVDDHDEGDVFGTDEELSLADRVQRSVMRNLGRGGSHGNAVQRAHMRRLQRQAELEIASSDDGDDSSLADFVVRDDDDDDDDDGTGFQDQDDDSSSRSTRSSVSGSTVRHRSRAVRSSNPRQAIVLSDSESESGGSSLAILEEPPHHRERRQAAQLPRRSRPEQRNAPNAQSRSRAATQPVTTEDSSDDDDDDEDDEDEVPVTRGSRLRKSRNGGSARPSRAIVVESDSDSESETIETTSQPGRDHSTSTAGDSEDCDDNGHAYISDDEGDSTECEHGLGSGYGDLLELEQQPTDYASVTDDDDDNDNGDW